MRRISLSGAFLLSLLSLTGCGDDDRVPVTDAGGSDGSIRDSGMVRTDAGRDSAVPPGDAGSCDDDNPCTVDTLGVAGCVNTPGNAGTECRASAGDCDVAEACSGTDAACPADAFAAETVECRASAGDCDVAETCSGSDAVCPADAFAEATVECRASAGDCDAAESCTGTGADCPADAFAPSSTECRASAGDCDAAESCTGTAVDCPADAFAPSTTECRASAADCDAAETCSGTSIDCPADTLAAAGVECRAAAGRCDAAETCDGVAATCPADAFEPATTVCRPASVSCDTAETCTGTAATCPADAPVGRLVATTGGSTMSGLYVLDRTTGTTISTIGPTGGYAITGLAQHPTTSVLYGVTTPNSPTSPQSLVTLNLTTGAATVVGSLSATTVADISFASDGTLYGWAEFDDIASIDDLTTINLTTGALSLLADSMLSTFGSGLAFAPDGVLFFAGDGSDGALRTIERTGVPASVVGTMTGTGEPVSALAFDNTGTLYGVENVVGAPSNLVVIDRATGALTVRGATAFQRLDGIAFVCP